MRKTAKKAAPVQTAAASKTNGGKSTAEKRAGQMNFDAPGFLSHAPERAEGGVADYLRTRPGWHDRLTVCAALGITEREVREQAEYSGGAVIFGSGRGQGLKHSAHAAAWEIRACAAELRYRAASHLRRADEVEQAGGLAR